MIKVEWEAGMRNPFRLLSYVGGGVIALCLVIGICAYIGVAVWLFLQGNLLYSLLWLFFGSFAVGLVAMIVVWPLALLAKNSFR